MKAVPQFAVTKDTGHHDGIAQNHGACWASLAMGADGLACALEFTEGQWSIPAAETGNPTGIAPFICIFGHACPLVFMVPASTTAAEQDYARLAQQLENSIMRWQPRLVVPVEHASILRTLAPSVTTYTLNTYGSPMPGEKNQALGLDTARAQFADLEQPLNLHPGHVLLVEMRPSGLLQPVAWLAHLSDQAPARRHKTLCTETFDGDNLPAVESRWALGYSNMANESSISLDKGSSPGGAALTLAFTSGFEYSGGGAVCRTPLVGDFDLRVGFSCTRRSLAAALELAVITVDPPPPGFSSMYRPDLKEKKTSLVFDVHGAPPYVSCECDEADGFRISWNRAYTLTRFVDEQVGTPPVRRTSTQSANHYNRYGSDIGPASTAAIEGELRLVRSRGFFASYVRVQGEAAWQCSGTLWNEQLPSQLYVRLAAKHWNKPSADGKPQTVPEHTVRFFNYVATCPAWSAA